MIQFIKFAIVGVINTVVDFGVLNVLIFFTGVASGIGFSLFKGISFLAAVGNSYILNKSWTFKDKSGNDTKKIVDFLFVSVVGLLINVGAASLIVNGFDPVEFIIVPASKVLGYFGMFISIEQIWSNIGALIATAVSLIWNFYGYKVLVFKQKVVDK